MSSHIRRSSYHAGTVVYKSDSTFYAHKRSNGVLTSDSNAQTILQAAFNNGGKVFICDATYPTTSQMTVPSDTYIECESWNTLIQGAGSHLLITNSDWVGGNNDIEIRGGTWDGNNGTSTDGGIIFDNTDNVQVIGVNSINSSAENIKVRNGTDTRIIGNRCYKSAIVGGSSARANINSATGSGRTVISGNTCIDAYGEAIGVFRATGYNVSVTNNVCVITTAADSPVRRGHILVEGTSGSVCDTVAITGNTVLSNYYGLNIISSEGITATGNSFKAFDGTNSLEGFHVSGTSSDITFVGNKVEGYGKHGFLVEDQTRRITIASNQFTDNCQLATNTYSGGYIMPRGGAVRELNCIGNNFVDSAGTHMKYGFHFDLDTRQLITANFSNNIIAGNTDQGALLDLGTTGELRTCQFMRNQGWNPVGNVSNPFNTTVGHKHVGLHAFGTNDTYAAAPEASTDYTAVNSDLLITSTGGTGVSISIIGPSAATITSGLTTLSGYYLPRTYKVNFGGFSVAPTVTVHSI